MLRRALNSVTKKAIDLLKVDCDMYANVARITPTNSRLNAEHEERLEEMRRQPTSESSFDQQLVLVKKSMQRSLTTSQSASGWTVLKKQLCCSKSFGCDDEVIRLEREEQKREALLVVSFDKCCS